MASKKYSMALGLLCLVASSAFAQEGTAYDWRDSSKIPAKRMPQQNEFLNNQYAFPAKPRDQWELGLSAGYMMILGNVPSRPGYGGGISVRKSLGHTFSIRASYTGSFAYGEDYKPQPGNSIGGIWSALYGNNPVYANYQTKTHMLSLDGILTLNNIKFYSDKVKTNWYLIGGYTLLAADVDVNAIDPTTGGAYPFGSIVNGSRHSIYTQLKDMESGGYKEEGVNGGNRSAIGLLHSYQVRHAFDLGAGFAYKLSPKFNIALEDKITFVPGDDYLDGVGGPKSDYFNYTSLRINMNLGSKSKRVEPLWWWNPLDYAYNELNVPKHMKIPTPILPDADGDGVTDQFDKEPNTPAGAPVDSHGVSRDTDGDGVPDYKDKELITPTICQPVDADGVGKCPDPACCKAIPAPAPTCALGSLPSITFKGHAATISADAKSLLVDVATQLRNNPNCKVTVAGHPAATKAAQSLNQKRVDAIKNYLIEKEGISGDRVIPQYDGGEGDVHTIDLRSGM
jgi:outer membrane protein OmpA-like peptidoglycan-associated protein